MDLSRVSNLTPAENVEIATAMHAMILNGIFSERSWRTPQAVFHGGTALSFTYNSGRFSEDLDFMLGEEAYKSIKENMLRVAQDLQISMNALYNGGKVEVVGPKGVEVQTWRFEWHHPNRRGKVRVKTEFLLTQDDVLKHYKTLQVVPMGRWHAAVNVSATIPAPELISSWADKIVAVAHRRDFKWRDAYDLAFLNMKFTRDDVDNDARFAAIQATLDIYKDVTLDTVLDGLGRDFVVQSLDSPVEFAEDMKNWMTPESWSKDYNAGIFTERLELAKQEIERAKRIITDLRPTGAKP